MVHQTRLLRSPAVAVLVLCGSPAWGFYMCQDASRCGQYPMKPWNHAPESLDGNKIASGWVPGVPDGGAYGEAFNHWQGSPPLFHGRRVNIWDIAIFAKELLHSNPFGSGNMVPYVDFKGAGDGKVVMITQRQLAFLVVNVLLGNDIPGSNGLTGALHHCSSNSGPNTGIVRSLLSFLAVLSQELHGGQGSMLIAATPRAASSGWKEQLEKKANTSLTKVNTCLSGRLEGNSSEGCHDLKDFMSGGNKNQALTDIAGAVVGGGAQMCTVANTQDESLVQFYSEVIAFNFFTQATHMLPVPWTLLGARRYMNALSGQSTSTCGSMPVADWLNDGIPSGTVSVSTPQGAAQVVDQAFVAVASHCEMCGHHCKDNVWNGCDRQRRFLDENIDKLYQAYAPSMYTDGVQDAFRKVVKRIGTGPWGAGAWHGDSQMSFLAVWLATSLLSDDVPVLDYYVYDHFCENAGNQCYVLGKDECVECLRRSGVHNLPPSMCGKYGVDHTIRNFMRHPVEHLYRKLKEVKGPPIQVFDHLLGVPSPVTTTTTTTTTTFSTTTTTSSTTTTTSSTETTTTTTTTSSTETTTTTTGTETSSTTTTSRTSTGTTTTTTSSTRTATTTTTTTNETMRIWAEEARARTPVALATAAFSKAAGARWLGPGILVALLSAAAGWCVASYPSALPKVRRGLANIFQKVRNYAPLPEAASPSNAGSLARIVPMSRDVSLERVSDLEHPTVEPSPSREPLHSDAPPAAGAAREVHASSDFGGPLRGDEVP